MRTMHMIPIHVASIRPKQKPVYLFLREVQDGVYQWFKMNTLLNKESLTPCKAKTISSAISQAHKHWKEEAFRLLHCGFRYALPGRDLVGCNALFWEMAKSYETFNGEYFDPEVGHLCFVDFASKEALEIWRRVSESKNRQL